jgi:predicted RNA-binding protein with EMAP domain
MNLLIAIMGDSYEKVKETERVQALHERAKIIVDMETQHPGWHEYSKYMHIAEAADEYGVPLPEWAGITGRVKQLLDQRVGQAQEELESKVDAVEERVGQAQDKTELAISQMSSKPVLQKSRRNCVCALCFDGI